MGKAKTAHASKTKQGIHSLLPIGRQVFSHLQESRVQSCVTGVGKTNATTPINPLPSFFFPQLFISEHDVIRHGISLCSVGVSCSGCVISQLLVLPQPPRWWGGVRSRKCDTV